MTLIGPRGLPALVDYAKIEGERTYVRPSADQGIRGADQGIRGDRNRRRASRISSRVGGSSTNSRTIPQYTAP